MKIEISKFLSFVLRHKPEAIGLTLDDQGWASIDELISAAKNNGRALDLESIQSVVRDNDKKRFAISDNGRLIRAVQGHSTSMVDLKHVEKVPPEFLYHGTATRFLSSILKNGLLPGSRHHVHLSQDESVAVSVGARHGTPAVLRVKSALMHEQGFKFFQADNGVWLTDLVPILFLEEIS